MLTQKELKRLFSYDPLTGQFTRKSLPSTRGRFTKSKLVGCKGKNGYLTIRIDYKLYLCHRLAWLYIHGEFPIECIDHINGVRDDNKLVNLRDIPKIENQKNMKLSSRNKSGVNGVSWFGRDSLWVVHTNINGKAIHIGRSKSIFEAACMSISARNKLNYHENHGRR